MDSLQKRLEALESKHSGPRSCSLGRAMNEMDEETVSILNRLLRNSKISTRSISIELQNDGYKIDRSTVSHHRNGHCVCDQGEAK